MGWRENKNIKISVLIIGLIIFLGIAAVTTVLIVTNIYKKPSSQQTEKPPPRSHFSFNGQVMSIDYKNKTLKVKAGVNRKIYKATLVPAGKVLVNDKAASFSDIKRGDNVALFSTTNKNLNQKIIFKADLISVTRLTKEILERLR